jgi:phage recombination protein Bet
MNGLLHQPAPPFLSTDECDLLKRTILKGYPDDEQEMFIRLCQRTRLDPFTKQIYATKRYQKVREADGSSKKVPTLVPVTGIIGLTAVADRTGQYDGCEIFWSGPEGEWKTEWLAEENPAAAKCIVYHKHRKQPEVAIARWFSYVGQTWDPDKRQWVVTDFWSKMPDYMLGKVAKAAALRGAFPDPLGNVYIREELESSITDAETETLPSDEARVEDVQRREAELVERLKKGPSDIKFVESKGPKPTPHEALEPAFEEDKIPEKPPTKKPASVQSRPAAPAASPAAATATPPDDLDMGDASPPSGPPVPQEPKTPPAGAGEVAVPWKDHVILGVSHVKFHKRRVGELNAAELAIIESQWLPAVREQWDDATDAQRADATAFEAAISHGKMVKPW